MTFECESSFLNSNKMQIRMQYKEETVLLSALLEKIVENWNVHDNVLMGGESEI